MKLKRRACRDGYLRMEVWFSLEATVCARADVTRIARAQKRGIGVGVSAVVVGGGETGVVLN